jgi:Ca2+-binding EF-hand superfamily protein
MSDARKEIILKAFQKMDKNSSGTITIDDLYGVYNVKSNPKYMRGELSEVKCFQEFLKSFDTPDRQDSVVSKLVLVNLHCCA